MPILNYTTKISEEKTVGEIMAILGSRGARSIRIDYDEQGRPSAVSFVLMLQDNPVPFRLPCNFDGVFRALLRDFSNTTVGRKARNNFERNPESKQQARRVAWRILKDWVEAQMALVQAEQAALAEVFLPYVVHRDGRTMFQHFLEHQMDPSRTLSSSGEEQ